MHVFVSWAFVSKAERAAATLDSVNRQQEQEDVEPLTVEQCLPEYAAYLKAVEAETVDPESLDRMNRDLLGVRIAIPEMEKVVTYQMLKRMPGSNKQPVSLAVRAFLLNTFNGEWTGDLLQSKPRRLIFVGHVGLRDFLGDLASCCGALGQPLPIDMWCVPANSPTYLELPRPESIRILINACTYHQKTPEGQQKYQDLIQGWMGPGASADRDNPIAVATAFRLGIKGNQG